MIRLFSSQNLLIRTLALTIGVLAHGLVHADSSISGAVSDIDGAPVENVEVNLYLVEGPDAVWVEKTTTDELGHYTFESLMPGIYRIKFVDPASRYTSEIYDDLPGIGPESGTDILLEAEDDLFDVDAELMIQPFVGGYAINVKETLNSRPVYDRDFEDYDDQLKGKFQLVVKVDIMNRDINPGLITAYDEILVSAGNFERSFFIDDDGVSFDPTKRRIRYSEMDFNDADREVVVLDVTISWNNRSLLLKALSKDINLLGESILAGDELDEISGEHANKKRQESLPVSILVGGVVIQTSVEATIKSLNKPMEKNGDEYDKATIAIKGKHLVK